MPDAPALPSGSTLGHSYEYGLQVNLGTHASPLWQDVRRISSFQPATTPKMQSAQTYDDFGADNEEQVSSNTTLTFGVQVNRSTSTGAYLDEVEALLARTRPSVKGSDAVIEARWFHKPETGTANPDDAGQGYFTVAVQRANTGADGAVEMLNITLKGKGPAWEITNPFTGWESISPAISSAAPAGAGTGDMLTLTGTGFTGTTGVTVNAIAADSTVVSDATLVIILPSDSAGDVDIVVTTPVGASSAFSYTRAA